MQHLQAARLVQQYLWYFHQPLLDLHLQCGSRLRFPIERMMVSFQRKLWEASLVNKNSGKLTQL